MQTQSAIRWAAGHQTDTCTSDGSIAAIVSDRTT